MIQLCDWYLEEENYISKEWRMDNGMFELPRDVFAYGCVFDHPNSRFYDGKRIHTSAVKKICLDSSKNRWILLTKSDHTYELLFSEMNLERFETTQSCFGQLEVASPDIAVYQSCRQKEEKKLLSRISAFLENEHLYLLLYGVYPQKAIYKNKAGELEHFSIEQLPASRTFQITDTKGEVVLRYRVDLMFIILEYWSETIQALQMECRGQIEVSQKNRQILLRKEDRTILRREEWEKIYEDK
ncbi:MAG: hypothetical protein ACI4HI_10070 [Lachnospiraceae bacterium]